VDRKRWRRAGTVAGITAAALLAASFVYRVAVRPSLDRPWVPEQSRMVRVERDGDLLTLRDIRAFDHCADGDSTIRRWDERTCDLRQLDSLWFVLSPFGRKWRGPAHPFLSFGFGDSLFVAISVEARKETGERYSIWRGLLRKYELMYVVAEERDPLGLRVRCYGDDVFLYPVRSTPERTRALFVDMLARAEELSRRPEFYQTVWNNCTTNVVDHANRVSTKRIPGGLRVLFPGYTDAIARALDLIDSQDADVDEMRRTHLVNERVERALPLPEREFSRAIRATSASPPGSSR
jgi:Domain of unknown function (DUF4105)